MDEASKLVSELQNKLAELDHKVWKYRRDMASEFEKYAEGLLRNVPKDVSDTVSKAIAESMKDYSSLNPDAASSIESCAPGTRVLSNGLGNDRSVQFRSTTAPMALTRQETVMDDGPDSPHDREKEFQGLFTPSYLPLLESTIRNERRSSYGPPTSAKPVAKGKENQMDTSQVDASTDARSLAPSAEVPRPPTPKRKNTDEVSIASDASDGPVRRSALRRSSSSSKTHSPRRVRFDVAGEEVLPTASPLPEKSILSEDTPPTSLGLGGSDDEAGSEQIEDIVEPPPRRISSSQALRALSRGPFEDDGTKWTTVSAPPDGSASVATANGMPEELFGELQARNGLSDLSLEESQRPLDIPGTSGGSQPATSAGTSSAKAELKHLEKTPSDDAMIDMPALKPMKCQKSSSASILSPVTTTNIDVKSPTASTRAPGTSWQDIQSLVEPKGDVGEGMKFTEDDHDELFHFDEDTEHRSSPREEEKDDSDTASTASPVAETHSTSPVTETRSKPVTLSSYSGSPARDIMKPAPKATNMSSSRGSVGSYKGHPFNMPIVSDEIHAQAASLGAINSFVGSVNGRSGLDESDVQSFRASGGMGSFSKFSGTPRSMSERMMMDEIMEAEEAKKIAGNR
jgi:hypothetical protein